MPVPLLEMRGLAVSQVAFETRPRYAGRQFLPSRGYFACKRCGSAAWRALARHELLQPAKGREGSNDQVKGLEVNGSVGGLHTADCPSLRPIG